MHNVIKVLIISGIIALIASGIMVSTSINVHPFVTTTAVHGHMEGMSK